MNQMKRWAAGLMLLLVPILPAQDIKKSGGSINYNNSRRIRHFSWANMDYGITNNGSKEATVRITSQPLEQRNITSYETSLTIGPMQRFRFSDMITIGSVSAYAVDMYANGIRLTSQTERVNNIRLAGHNDRYILFINDDIDLSYGNFAKNEFLGAKYVNVFNRGSTAARHLAAYDNAAIVVLYRPDFSRFSSRQYKAILDYVARGGTLLLGNPAGTMDAWNTPLRKCFPVTPLRIRKVERVAAFRKLGGSTATWDGGTDFLESVPRGDGMTTLHHEDFPLVRWRKYGLGYVGVTAVSPSDDLFVKEHRTATSNFCVYWRHILSFAGRNRYVSSSRDVDLAGAVDKMTGIEIPGAGFIRNVVIGYMLVVILLVAGGVLLKQHVKAWLALSVVAFVGVAAVFVYAANLRKGIPTKTATILEFSTIGSEDASTEQLMCLFRKGEETIDLMNTSPDTKLRSMPPALDPQKAAISRMRSRKSKKRSKKKPSDSLTSGKNKKPEESGDDEALRDTLRISTKNAASSLLKLNLRDSRPQFFNLISSNRPGTDLIGPALTWTTEGPVVEAWKLPDSVNCEYAVLVCEEGYFPLKVKGRELSRTAKLAAGIEKARPIFGALRNFMVRADMPGPLIAAFASTKEDGSGFLQKKQGFEIIGRRVTLIPVKEVITGGEVTVPYQRMAISQPPRERRNLRIIGTWVASDTMGLGNMTLFTAILPPGFASMKTKELTIKFDIENTGGNMTFDLYLLPKGELSRKVKLERRDDGLYIIKTDKLKTADIVNPADGHVEFAFEAKQKQQVRDPVARARLNSWKLRSIAVSARGTLPNELQGRL